MHETFLSDYAESTDCNVSIERSALSSILVHETFLNDYSSPSLSLATSAGLGGDE